MIPQNLNDIQAALLAGTTTMTAIVEAYLTEIEKTRAYNAYIEVFTEELREAAKQLDHKIQNQPDDLAPLFGAVVSIKDNFCYKDHLVTSGSKILADFKSPYSATVVKRLLAADALIIGRTNCDELSMGSTCETSYYGPTKNAIDPERIPGGSSGGAAVSVALNTCLIAIGSDTGGSIRQPAAFNGVVGYKPTYGAIPRWGLVAYSSSLDTIGFIAKGVEDISAALAVVSGPDDYDSTALPDPLPQTLSSGSPETKPKLAFSASLLKNENLDANIKAATQTYLARLEQAGFSVEAIDFEYEDYFIPTYYILATAEASSNLSRFDGIRYGHRTEKPVTDYRDLIKLSRTEGFGKEVKKRIMLGTYVLSESAYDAYFKQAQQVRTLIKEEVDGVLQKYDYLLMPTSTTLPWKLGAIKDPIQVYLSDLCTILANLCGHPAVSIPVYTKADDFPLGIQLIAHSNQDFNLLNFASQLVEQQL